MTKKQKELDKALSNLANKFDFGSLQASTNPVDFINRVTNRINELETALKKIAEYTAFNIPLNDHRKMLKIIDRVMKQHFPD